MKSTVTTHYLDNMSFESEVNGHKIIIDAPDEASGQNRGPRPKQLVLTALAGCTAMDVVSILKKMKVEYSDYKIIAEADMADEHPKLFLKIHVIHQFTGKNLPLDKLTKAVSLSDEKYCGVGATLRKAVELSWEIKIVEE